MPETEAKAMADLIWELELFVAKARTVSRLFRELGFPATAANLTELAARYDTMASRLAAQMVPA
jgi:hypothetical protein